MTEAIEKLFELKLTPSQVLLRVAPPSEGKKASLSDIQKELGARGVSYRHDHLFEIYRRASNQFEILATRETDHYEVVIEVQKDGMQAAMTIIPPQRGEERLNPEMIKKALRDAHVSKGILYEEIQRAIHKHIENEPVVIARGKAAVQGIDGEIEFMYDQAAPGAPARRTDQVDFKELGLIKNVQEGQTIARIKPPTAGEAGFTVQGGELKAKAGRAARIKLGRNVVRSEDGTELRAAASGYVLVSSDRVSVENVYQVNQVNTETGNIHFAGVVMVKGNIEDNFTVEADKGIEVGGSIGRAMLRTEGDVKARGGAIGARIDAQRNVSAKFFSECTIGAGESVTAEDYILHSTIQAGKSVRVVKGPSGFINGGVTRAGETVISPNLGSNVAEEKTQIEAGMRPNSRAQFDALGLQMEKNEANFEKLRKNLLVLQHQRETQGVFEEQRKEAFEKLLETAQHVRQQLMEGVRSYRTLSTELAEGEVERGYVLVENTVFPGVTVQIRRQSFAIKSPLVGSGFRLVHGEIKVQDVDEVTRIYRGQHGRLPA